VRIKPVPHMKTRAAVHKALTIMHLISPDGRLVCELNLGRCVIGFS